MMPRVCGRQLCISVLCVPDAALAACFSPPPPALVWSVWLLISLMSSVEVLCISVLSQGANSDWADSANLGIHLCETNNLARCRTDKGPLVQGCTCYACKRHNRAYIHHLLQSNEMLVSVISTSTLLHRMFFPCEVQTHGVFLLPACFCLDVGISKRSM